MTTKQFFLLIIASTTLFACKKSSSSNAINVGCIPWVDYNGENLGIYPGGGCPINGNNSDTLTSSQLALFQSLDTATLPNTYIPDSVLTKYTPLIYWIFFPSPFKNIFSIGFSYLVHSQINSNVPFPSPVMFKYVVVDSTMKPQDKGAKLIGGRGHYTVAPNVPVGRFRLYLTLSTLSHPNYYQAWFNIQKIQ